MSKEDTVYELKLAEGCGVDSVAVSAVDANYEELAVDVLVTWDEAKKTLTANPSASQNGTVFLDLMSGNEPVYTVSVRVVSAYPTRPAYDINRTTVEEGELPFIWAFNSDGEFDENVIVHDPSLTEVEMDGAR